MKRLYFGTDGVRGPYGSATMNEDFAWRLGAAAAAWLKTKGVTGGRVLIGRDTRASGASLSQALADGLTEGGFESWSLGVLPTPAVSRAVRTRSAVLGVVVTASHNPATDNGIKFFGPAGVKLTDEEEAAIEALLPAKRSGGAHPLKTTDGVADYLAGMAGILRGQLTGWAIVLDTANGATVQTSAQVLRDHGARVIAIGAEPNGRNINDHVGSEHPEKMAAAVRAHQARLGIAHDGDGDRCVLCDETGAVLDGDELLTILALGALALLVAVTIGAFLVSPWPSVLVIRAVFDAGAKRASDNLAGRVPPGVRTTANLRYDPDDAVVAAGAVPVTSRELIVRLRGAGLRRRKRSYLAPEQTEEE